MTKKELENVLQEVLIRLQKIEAATPATAATAKKAEKKAEKKEPLLLLRFAFNNWDLRRLMKIKRVKWNANGKGWEINGKVSREELGSHDYEIVEL